MGVGDLGVWGLRFVLAQPLCAPCWPLSGAVAALALHALKTATLALQSLKTVTLAACCRWSACAAAAASSICRRASASNGASRFENSTGFRYYKLTLWCPLRLRRRPLTKSCCPSEWLQVEQHQESVSCVKASSNHTGTSRRSGYPQTTWDYIASRTQPQAAFMGFTFLLQVCVTCDALRCDM